MKAVPDPRYSSIVSGEEGYKLWAETYDVDPNPLLAAEERTLEPLLPSLAGKVVLDIACGTGRWLEKLLSAGATAGAGIDSSSAMIDIARAKPILYGHLTKGDCLALPFRSEFADLIICSFALAHMASLEVFARELARVAKPAAQLYMSDLHPEAYARGWRTGFRHKRKRIEITASPRAIGETHRALRLCGFDLVRCHDLHLGESEKLIFEQARKSHLFEASCAVPAVHICQFSRNNQVSPAAWIRNAS